MATQFERGHRYGFLVPFLICLGAILRIYNFWVPPVWVDEYGTWWVVAANAWSEVIERTLRIQGQSPLYYLIVRTVAELGGYGAFQLRLLSVICGIAALALVYPLAVKIFNDRRVALLSLIIFALSEPLIWYAQIARPYSLALFFSLLSFWSFVSLENSATTSVRAVYVLSTAMTVYAHYLFGLIVVIQIIYLVIRAGLRTLFSKLWLTNFVALTLLLAPMSGHVLYLHSRRHALDWITSADSSWKIAGIIIYIIGGASPAAILATIFVVIILGFRRSELKFTETRSKLALPIVWYLIPLLLVSVVPILLGVNLGQPRYLLFAYPATYLLLAWFMLNVRTNGCRKWLPTAVFVLATLFFVSIPALSGTQTFARWPNRAWNDALAKLAQLYTSDDLVVAQIGLVEADLLADDDYDRKLLSYLSWPLVKTLPGLKADNIAILPYRLTEHTEIYLRSLFDRTVQYPRIWLVGGGELVSLFRDHLVNDINYTLITQTNHGAEYHVFCFQRIPPLHVENS
jgi:4-amino-4-deoxy-L-arabinose transferase-like glycosyltransferase